MLAPEDRARPDAARQDREETRVAQASVLDRFRLDGRTAIVLGAGPGIGAHVARAYAAVGANVVVASRTLEKMEALAEEIRAGGGSALAVAADAGKAEDLERLARSAEDAFGPIHILFFNATTGALPI